MTTKKSQKLNQVSRQEAAENKHTHVTPLNAHARTDQRRTEYPPSLTIPDQTMPIREILERYARGLPISGQTSDPIYLGEEGLGIDARQLDLTEKQQILQKGKEIQRQITLDQEIEQRKQEKEEEDPPPKSTSKKKKPAREGDKEPEDVSSDKEPE